MLRLAAVALVLTCLATLFDPGRSIVTGFVSREDTQRWRVLADRALAVGKQSGSVGIFDIPSGAVTYDSGFVSAYRNMVFELQPREQKMLDATIDGIRGRVRQTRDLQLARPMFFSRITHANESDLQSGNPNDQYWHAHVDVEQYKGFQHTCLIYLNEDFEGGEFEFLKWPLVIRPQEGMLNCFDSGHMNPHRLRKVQRGVRYALTVPFE